MTLQEAKEILKGAKWVVTSGDSEKVNEAIRYLISIAKEPEEPEKGLHRRKK